MIGSFKLGRKTPSRDALTLQGKTLRISASSLIGSGGEAEIFDLGQDIALKRFKQPDHPDFALSTDAQTAAQTRLNEHQHKIPALLLQPLPQRVAAPSAPVFDCKGLIAGYTMPLIRGGEVLLRYGDRPFREHGGVTMPSIIEVLRDLHQTVSTLHAHGLVIGDFNDLNVLVRGTEAHLIDIDSAQFGAFTSTLFTARFLDPRLTDGRTAVPIRPHDLESDWFAFAVMAFRLLLLVDPFGGIHKPAGGARRVGQDLRAVERISVLHPDVKVPRQALPFDSLPDGVLQHFLDVFERDRRGVFPLTLLAALPWTRCQCGLEHTRANCPLCATAAPRVARAIQVVRGRITSNEIFRTSGVIVAAAIDDDRLLWLEHRDGTFIRDDGTPVFRGPLDPRLRFALQPGATCVTRGDETLIFRAVAPMERLRAASIAANRRHRYWIDDGTLLRDDAYAPEVIGNILGGQTRFWIGPSFGFGFYRASAMTVGFVFDAEARGIRDDVALAPIGGQIVDAEAVFTRDRCWLFLATQELGRLRRRCTVIRRDGTIEATHEEEPKEGSWLARLHGNGAAGHCLLAATDDGLVRIEPDRGGLAVTATFPDSEAFADASTRLFVAPTGVYAVGTSRIDLLRMGEPDPTTARPT